MSLYTIKDKRILLLRVHLHTNYTYVHNKTSTMTDMCQSTKNKKERQDSAHFKNFTMRSNAFWTSPPSTKLQDEIKRSAIVNKNKTRKSEFSQEFYY